MHEISISEKISENMPVICADGHDHGLVDSIDGQYIKLAKDESGQHHWLPLSAVSSVDEVVHLSLGHGQTKEALLSEDPHPAHRDE